MCYAQCCHGDGSGVRHVHIKYHGHLLYYQATVLAIVVYCLMLFTFIVAMATVVMGDTCSKYHGHTHYYQATMLVIVINCPEVICCCHLLFPWRW